MTTLFLERASRSLAKTGFFGGSKSTLFTTFLQHLGEIRISGAGSRSGSILGSLQGAFWEPFGDPFGVHWGPLWQTWWSFGGDLGAQGLYIILRGGCIRLETLKTSKNVYKFIQ